MLWYYRLLTLYGHYKTIMFHDSVMSILVVGLCQLSLQINPTTSQAISEGINRHCLSVVSNFTLRCGRNQLHFGINQGFPWERLQCSRRTSQQPSVDDAIVSCTESFNASCVCGKISPLECTTVYRCQSNHPTYGSLVELVLRNHASCDGSSQSSAEDQFTVIGCGENAKSRYWKAVDHIHYLALKNQTDFEIGNGTVNETFTCFSLEADLYYSSGLCQVVVTKEPNMTTTIPMVKDGAWKPIAIILIVFSTFSFLVNIILCFCCRKRSQRNVPVNNVVAPVARPVKTATSNNPQNASNLQNNGDLCGYTCLKNSKKENINDGYTALVKHNVASYLANRRNVAPKRTNAMQNVESTSGKTQQNRGIEPQPAGNGRPARPARPVRPARPGHLSAMESSGAYEDINDDPQSPGSRRDTYLEIEESDEFTYDYTDDDQTRSERSLATLYGAVEYANDGICRKAV